MRPTSRCPRPGATRGDGPIFQSTPGAASRTIPPVADAGAARNRCATQVIAAGLGAASFALVEDRLGAKVTVLVSLAGLMVLGAGLLAADGRALFWALGLPIGVFMGPAQAASRSLMARMATPGEESAHFGLFALSGRVTAFAGPAVLAATVSVTGSQTAGMATVLVFLALGAAILLTVRAPE